MHQAGPNNGHSGLIPSAGRTVRIGAENEPVESPDARSESTTDDMQELLDRLTCVVREFHHHSKQSINKAIEVGRLAMKIRVIDAGIHGDGHWQACVQETITPLCGVRLRMVQKCVRLAKLWDQYLEQSGDKDLLHGTQEFRNEFQPILEAISIGEAIDLLDALLRGESPSNAQEESPESLRIADSLGNALDDFAVRHVVTNDDGPNWLYWNMRDDGPEVPVDGPPVLLCPGSPSLNLPAVQTLVGALDAGDLLAGFLLLSHHSAARWLPLLDAMPRVRLRSAPFEGAAGKTKYRPTQLFGLFSCDRIPSFCECMTDLGAVFVPFQPDAPASDAPASLTLTSKGDTA